MGPCSVAGHIPTLPWVRSGVWVKGWVRARASFRGGVGRDVARNQARSVKRTVVAGEDAAKSTCARRGLYGCGLQWLTSKKVRGAANCGFSRIHISLPVLPGEFLTLLPKCV